MRSSGLRHKRLRSGGGRTVSDYAGAETKSRLSFYGQPPEDEVSVVEFEQFGTDRLNVLKGLEQMRVKGLSVVEQERETRRLLEVNGLKIAGYDDGHTGNSVWRAARAEAMRKDRISHYVLRLAFCRTDELRRWFLTHECALFRFRFEEGAEDAATINDFLRDNQMDLTPLDEAEYASVAEDLAVLAQQTAGHKSATDRFRDAAAAADTASGMMVAGPGGVLQQQYFKVPWEDVLDLVQHRRVVLKGGSAYIHRNQLVSIVMHRYRSSLSRSLVNTFRAMAATDREGERVRPFLNGLSTQASSAASYSGSVHKGVLDLSSVDDVAKKSYPMCMRDVHTTLRDTHHLKHTARNMYTLFIKGLGMTLEDALALWRKELSISRGADSFDKNYAYNIRHNYGKEGKRTDYSPYSCAKIIAMNPSQGEQGGCPYKLWNAEKLSAHLGRMHLSNGDVREVVEKAAGGHYQVACLKVFELTHPKADVVWQAQHPNDYADSSITYFNAKNSDVAVSSPPASTGAGSAPGSAGMTMQPLGGGTGFTPGGGGGSSMKASPLQVTPDSSGTMAAGKRPVFDTPGAGDDMQIDQKVAPTLKLQD